MADWDVFAKLTRKGRKARGSCASGLAGGDFDPNPVAGLVDAQYSAAEGLPSLVKALDALTTAGSHGCDREAAPVREALRQLAVAVRAPGATLQDLVLEARVQRAIANGSIAPHAVLSEFFDDCIVRGAIDCRDGLLENASREERAAMRERVRQMSKDVTDAAASRVLARPGGKTLGLARQFPSSVTLSTRLV